MNSKIFLLTVAVAAVGLFAMPNSLTLFAGQHTFDDGNNVSCRKCHQDIYDEIKGASNFGISTAHADIQELQDCKGCHRTGNLSDVPLGKFDTGVIYTGDYNRTNLSGAHAAVTMECAGCHTGVPAELLNGSEAHGAFYNESITNSTDNSGRNNGTLLKGANEACVGCHTHTNVKATWKRSIGYDMVVNETTNGTYNIIFTANNSYNLSTTQGGNVSADGP